ncbi:VTT domain-containing protein [Candidatus Saccharibacteria bacterium]|nr:VTT domain-containing protein [Candidatus Saccharibacteria bacterium]NIW80215.1 hypothetical protein [Calditrichia bacterium]
MAGPKFEFSLFFSFKRYSEQNPVQWHLILPASGTVLITTVLLIYFLPEFKNLILFTLYSVPTHILISPLPHEPAIVYCAKYYSPLLISIAGALGCCVAGFLDYRLFSPIINHRSLRSRYENRQWFKKSLALFNKSPFWWLVIAGYSPLPLHPFKFLSIAGNYPLWKFQMAMIVGRTPRFYTFALLGYLIQPPTWLLILAGLLLLILPFVKKLIDRFRIRTEHLNTTVETTPESIQPQ